jgi:hypothetical protein
MSLVGAHRLDLSCREPTVYPRVVPTNTHQKEPMSRNPRTPLSTTEEEALEIITDPIDGRGEKGYPRNEVHQLLADHEAFSQELAEQAIHQLLMKGYLYEVDGHLFVTPGALNNQ